VRLPGDALHDPDHLVFYFDSYVVLNHPSIVE
jgi:hypothetical protein